jgi:pilus assembly protein CpaB
MAEPSGQKAIVYLIGAVVFGLVAAILSYLFLQSRAKAIEAELRGERDTLVDVVIAKQDLPKGLKITDQYFEIGQVPGKYVHPNALRPTNFFDYAGRFLATDMQAGKTLLDSFLVEDFPIDFSDLVSQGRRAITVTVDDVSSFSGLLRPGNRIDLYVNIPTNVTGFTPGGAIPVSLPGPSAEAGAEAAAGAISAATAPRDVILPVLQDVRVLATGREAYDETLDKLSYPQQRRSDNFTNIALDVTPEQAALISVAEDKGDLIAVLRNRNDRSSAEFTGVTPLDLVRNARRMQQAEAMRQAAAAMGATIDANGNLVTADGRVIPADQVVVGPDGSIRTKDGKLLAPSEALRKAAAAAGATIDENGNWVTADGKVIPADQIVVGPNGTVTTRDGKVLAAQGIRVNEKGEYVDASGKVIPPGDIVVNPDGSVTTKDEIMKAAGYTVNANGDYVDANGNVVKKEDVQVLANGTVMTRDGKVLSGPPVTRTKDGFLVAADGTVMTADGKVLQGVTVNENGEVVTSTGEVLKDPNLTVDADGTVRDGSGQVIAGVTGSNLPPQFVEAAAGIPGAAEAVRRLFITLTIGGSSKDGVPMTTLMPVQPVGQANPAEAGP